MSRAYFLTKINQHRTPRCPTLISESLDNTSRGLQTPPHFPNFCKYHWVSSNYARSITGASVGEISRGDRYNISNYRILTPSFVTLDSEVTFNPQALFPLQLCSSHIDRQIVFWLDPVKSRDRTILYSWEAKALRDLGHSASSWVEKYANHDPSRGLYCMEEHVYMARGCFQPDIERNLYCAPKLFRISENVLNFTRTLGYVWCLTHVSVVLSFKINVKSCNRGSQIVIHPPSTNTPRFD